MDDRQKYLFDVRGYLELDDVLTRDQCRRLVDEMKRLIDLPDEEKPEGVSSKDEPTQANLGDLTSAGAEFCALIDIPRVIDVLKVDHPPRAAAGDHLRVHSPQGVPRPDRCTAAASSTATGRT